MTFGGAPFTNDRLPKIIVLGDHREAVISRISPDLLIGRAGKANQVDMGAVWELISQCATRRELKFSSNNSFKTRQAMHSGAVHVLRQS